jgi:PAS domain S-box-containing protein
MGSFPNTEPRHPRNGNAEGPLLDFSLFEHAPDAMLVVDGAGRVVFANRHLLMLLGFPAEALMGRPVEELMPGRFHGAHQHLRSAYMTGPVTRPMGTGRMLLARRADGREVTVEISLSPVQIGADQYVVAALRDVTERLRIQYETALLNEAAAIAATAGPVEQIMWATIRAICRYTPFRDGGWFAMDRDGAAADPVPTWYPSAATSSDWRQHELLVPDVRDAFTCTCRLAAHNWRSTRAAWIDDLGDGTLGPSAATVAEAFGARTMLIVPMADAQASYATIVLARADAASRDGALIDLVMAVIGRVVEELGRRRVERTMLDAARLASSVFEYTAEPKLLLNSALIVELVNPAFHEAFGAAPESMVGRPFFDTAGGAWDTPELRQLLRAAVETDDRMELALDREFPDIGMRHLVVSTRGVHREDESGRWLLLSINDRTDTLRREELFSRASRLESIGRLASGVAHDFNNLLVPILGSADAMLEQLATSDPLHRHADMIRNAADRAATLTRQLLAYGRPQPLLVQPTNVGAILADSHSLIASLVGESITLTTAVDDGVSHALIDRDQISYCLLNLAINAHDAMPDGGTLAIEAANTAIIDASDDPESIRPLSPGDYVLLSIRDTGRGMDTAIRARLFEPFFSTKGSSGTGLGLSTVDGAIAQMHGNIAVTSEPGRGTTFRLYLPATPEPASAIVESTQPATVSSGGSESILLVEGDPDVRAIVAGSLSEAGYATLAASSPADAILLSRRHRARIDLLLTDVMMPGKTGHDLAAQLREGRPTLRVLYMSGFAGHDSGTPPRGQPVVGPPTISKPFTAAALLRLVRRVLDSGIGES